MAFIMLRLALSAKLESEANNENDRGKIIDTAIKLLSQLVCTWNDVQMLVVQLPLIMCCFFALIFLLSACFLSCF